MRDLLVCRFRGYCKARSGGDDCIAIWFLGEGFGEVVGSGILFLSLGCSGISSQARVLSSWVRRSRCMSGLLMKTEFRLFNHTPVL